MDLSLTILLWAVMVATATLSGVFGMAGGLILIGILLALLPLPEAMALHAVTQIASNLWRAAFTLRHVRWPSVGAILAGCVAATALWSAVLYVPPKPLALLALGVSPFLLTLVPDRWRPVPERASHGVACGIASMSLMLLAGVSGPLIDHFFLGGRFDRHAIVATKAVCQVGAHGLKLLYFGAVIADPGAVPVGAAIGAVVASLLGTWLARPLLNAMSEATYRRWAGRIVTAIALVYIGQGAWLLLLP